MKRGFDLLPLDDVHDDDEDNNYGVDAADYDDYGDGTTLAKRNEPPTPPSNSSIDELLTAAKLGDLNCVKELVSKGVDINEQCCNALGLASAGGHYDVVEYLLDHGAVGYASDAFKNGTSNNGDWYCGPVTVAVHNNHIEVARLLISRGANADEMACFKKGSLLYIAAGNGNIDMARMLLDQGATAAVLRDDYQPPACEAIMNGHWNMVLFLSKTNPDPNAEFIAHFMLGQDEEAQCALEKMTKEPPDQFRFDAYVINGLESSISVVLRFPGEKKEMKKKVDWLLNQGADINYVSPWSAYESTVLSAVKIGWDKADIEWLISRGARITTSDLQSYHFFNRWDESCQSDWGEEYFLLALLFVAPTNNVIDEALCRELVSNRCFLVDRFYCDTLERNSKFKDVFLLGTLSSSVKANNLSLVRRLGGQYLPLNIIADYCSVIRGVDMRLRNEFMSFMRG